MNSDEMALNARILEKKLIEAWKFRFSEASFSESLSSLVAKCQSEEEFRTLFTSKINQLILFPFIKLFIIEQILAHIDSATSSSQLQSYFKFHTRSGYIDESLIIERLLSLKPSISSIVDDMQIKFLLELLSDTLKTMDIIVEQAIHLGKQINSLAKWFCTALCVYSNGEMTANKIEMLRVLSNLFLLFFTNMTYYYLWLMTIKAQEEQTEWRQLQDRLIQSASKISTNELTLPDVYEQIVSK